jgi:hypothetical protein
MRLQQALGIALGEAKPVLAVTSYAASAAAGVSAVGHALPTDSAVQQQAGCLGTASMQVHARVQHLEKAQDICCATELLRSSITLHSSFGW